jgi:adapter protein MecA 1/2
MGKEVVPLKIERINENQIRCTLTSVDLSARNIRLSELAYGSDKTRNLFREMIQQASIETGFDADDIPLVIEAIPLNSGSIMLIITKVEDPEELDSRFSRFTPSPEEDMEDQIPPMESEQLDGADSLMNLLNTFAASMSGADPANLDADGGAHSGLVRPAAESGQDSAVNRLSGEPGTDSTANQPAGNAGADSTLIRPAGEPGSDSTLIRPAGGQDVSGAQDRAADSDTGNASFADSALAGASGSGKPATRFYAFPDLDAAITAAKICDRAYAGKSTLYKSPAGTFLLVLHVDDAENLPFIHICNRLSDFASRQKHPEATEAFYAEHYDLIIREDALRHLAEL